MELGDALSLQALDTSSHSNDLTVVLIHMRQATLAPMAAAPAVPPRIADLAALFKISSMEGGVSFSSVAILTVYAYIS